jgi:hypothetical protein
MFFLGFEVVFFIAPDNAAKFGKILAFITVAFLTLFCLVFYFLGILKTLPF